MVPFLCPHVYACTSVLTRISGTIKAIQINARLKVIMDVGSEPISGVIHEPRSLTSDVQAALTKLFLSPQPITTGHFVRC